MGKPRHREAKEVGTRIQGYQALELLFSPTKPCASLRTAGAGNCLIALGGCDLHLHGLQRIAQDVR